MPLQPRPDALQSYHHEQEPEPRMDPGRQLAMNVGMGQLRNEPLYAPVRTAPMVPGGGTGHPESMRSSFDSSSHMGAGGLPQSQGPVYVAGKAFANLVLCRPFCA